MIPLCQDEVLPVISVTVTTEVALPGLPHSRHCVQVSVTVAQGVISVIVSGLADGRCVRAPIGPLSPSTGDSRVLVVPVVLKAKVLRSKLIWVSARPGTKRKLLQLRQTETGRAGFIASSKNKT